LDFSDRSRTLIEKSASLPKALVAAVGVGVAFGAGLVAGGIGKADAAVVADVDPVVSAQARTTSYEARMKGVQLTWHKELTSFDPELPAAPRPATPAALKPAAPLAEDPSSSPIVDRAVLTAPLPPEPVARPVARAEADADTDDSDDADARAPDPKRLGAAITRVLGEKTKTDPVSEKRYAVQLASTSTQASAVILAETWSSRGVKALVVSAEVPGKGTMYRVRVEGIASRAAADALKARLGQGLVVND